MAISRKTTSTNYRNEKYLENKCSLNELIHLLSKRWMTEVLFSIEEGNSRFSSLKKDLEQISDNILADRLRLLENYGLITKNELQYALTPVGAQLSEHLDKLCQFADAHMQSLCY